MTDATNRQELVRETYKRTGGKLVDYNVQWAFLCEGCLEARPGSMYAGSVVVRIERKEYPCPLCDRCVMELIPMEVDDEQQQSEATRDSDGNEGHSIRRH